MASPRHARRGLDHRQQGLTIPVDREAVERMVAVAFDVGVVPQRKVAAVHVHATQREAVPILPVEAGPQEGVALAL